MKNIISHNNCLLCGKSNPFSLGLNFVSAGEKKVSASFKVKEFLQGYDGVLHGGVIMALLDSAMVHCIFAQNTEAMTAAMSVKFIKAIPVESDLAISAEIIKSNGFLFVVKGKIELDHQLMVYAESKFIKIKENIK